MLGDPKAPITLTEYLDPQCPICAQAAQETLPTVIKKYVRTGKVKLQARTLSFIGPDSVRAAKVAAGAAQQGKLWAFLETFYASQGTENSGYVTDEFLTDVAKASGVDAEQALAFAGRRQRAGVARPGRRRGRRAEGRLDAELHGQAWRRRRDRASPSGSTTCRPSSTRRSRDAPCGLDRGRRRRAGDRDLPDDRPLRGRLAGVRDRPRLRDGAEVRLRLAGRASRWRCSASSATSASSPRSCVDDESARTATAFLSIVGLGFSGWLTYVEVVELNAICIWCVGSAICMTLLAGLSIVRLLTSTPPELARAR